MRRSNKTQFAVVRFAILLSALTLTTVYSAYAQSSTPDKAVARMLIVGIPGDIHDGTMEVIAIEYEDVTFSLGSSAGSPAGRVVWEYALPGGRTIVRTGWDFGSNRQF